MGLFSTDECGNCGKDGAGQTLWKCGDCGEIICSGCSGVLTPPGPTCQNCGGETSM